MDCTKKSHKTKKNVRFECHFIELLKTSLLSESSEATSTITDKAGVSKEVSDL